MHARAFHSRKLGTVVTVRLLDDGDTTVVAALFERLSPASRERRFHAAKPHLTSDELDALARVDGHHHVLVAYVDGDERPAAMARVVRNTQTAVAARSPSRSPIHTIAAASERSW